MTDIIDPLGSLVAEIERGVGLQEPTPKDKRFETQCQEAQLDIDKEIPAPPVAIYIGNSPACTFGNFSA